MRPAMAWQAKMSSVSSTLMIHFNFVPKLAPAALSTAIATAEGEPTYPYESADERQYDRASGCEGESGCTEAGVIPTRPATAPLQNPTADHFLSNR